MTLVSGVTAAFQRVGTEFKSVYTALGLKADKASPALTGTPTAPTAAGGTNTTQIATTAFVKAAADAKVVQTITNGVTATAPSEDAVFDALALKAPLASPAFTGTPTGITKSHVGLGSVDNTADSAKPVSTAQQTALDLKADKASPTFTGTVAAPTPSGASNDTTVATTAFVKTAAPQRSATNVSGSGIPWQSEAIINSAALASGYNDLEGGLLFDRQVVLRQLSFRLAPYNATIGGSGNLTIDWYQSAMNASPGTLITTTTIAAGQHDVVTTLGSPYTVPVNTVVRANITLGTTTVAVKCHIQLRGDVDVN